MNQEIESLAQLSDDLTSTSLSGFGELLAKRRVVLDNLVARQGLPDDAAGFAAAFRAGDEARSRLLIELGALRAKIEDLRRLRTGLGQLRPIQATPPSLDVRL
ncbi:MAG: hypothetical protein O3A53_07085 [Acidobacteria bacterium]|nr:hypothetical protein [Acidobacteriota bacterium]MDA1234548.1 hypothetical protein [Acidobacteriota bacterium]